MIGSGAGGGIGGGIGNAIGGIIGLATMGKGGKDELREAVKLWQKLQQPEFDARELTPPQLQLVAEYFPETYEAVVPEEVRLTQDSPYARGVQQDAVGRLDTYASEGLPLSERINAREAQLQLAGEAGAQDDAIRRNLAARGRLGGGTEAALRQGRSQIAANMAADMGNDLLRERVENRYRSALAAAQQGAALRAGDVDLSSRNANAVNRFNELISSLKNRAAQDNWGQRVTANEYNLGTRQRLAEENARSKYGVDLENLSRKNNLKQLGYENEVTRLRGQTGALGNLADAKYAEQAARLKNTQAIGQGVGQAAGSVVGGFI